MIAVTACYNLSIFALFRTFLESLNSCLYIIFNAGEFLFYFFSWFKKTLSLLGCMALYVVINFLVLLSICLTSSRIHFDNSSKYKGDCAQVFVFLLEFGFVKISCFSGVLFSDVLFSSRVHFDKCSKYKGDCAQVFVFWLEFGFVKISCFSEVLFSDVLFSYFFLSLLFALSCLLLIFPGSCNFLSFSFLFLFFFFFLFGCFPIFDWSGYLLGVFID